MLLFINFHYLTLSHRTFSHLVFFFFPQRVRFRSYALILFLTHSGKGHNSISLSSSGTAAFKKWLHTLSWQPKHGKREINLTQRPRIKKKSVVVRGGGRGGRSKLERLGRVRKQALKLYTNSAVRGICAPQNHTSSMCEDERWEGEGAGINPYYGLICIALGCCRRRVWGDLMKCQQVVISTGAGPGK